MNCPNPTCRSTSIISNRFSDDVINNVAQGAQVLQHAGYRAPAAFGLGAAALMRGINSLRYEWRCTACGSRF